MEFLVPIAIVTIGIGLLLLLLRRPTVVRPPTITSGQKADAVTAPPVGDDTMQRILSELEADMPPGGTKRVTILKGNTRIGWAVTKRVDQTALSPDKLRELVGEGSAGKLAGELVPKLGSDAVSANAPPEASLQYPGSSLVVSSVETKRGSASGSNEFRDVRKTTFASEADGDEVLGWYHDWLLAHGWQLASSADAPAPSSRQYARGSEHFRLAIGDPATIRELVAVPIPDGAKTVYEVEYRNSSATATPP